MQYGECPCREGRGSGRFHLRISAGAQTSTSRFDICRSAPPPSRTRPVVLPHISPVHIDHCRRWDAFYNASSGTDGANDPGVWTARVLQPLQWHDRLPWYSYILPDGNVTFNGNAPDVMDAEIALAVGGIGIPAFRVPPRARVCLPLLARMLVNVCVPVCRRGD